MYSSALKASGYNNELQYTEKIVAKKRLRRRNFIRFNPAPWNDEVSTNVAKKFLSIIDRHFPKGSALGKLFNRSTVKVSCSRMPNMARIILGHDKKVTGSSSRMGRPRAATVAIATLPAGREVQDHQPCLQEHCGGLWHHQAVHRTHLKHLQGEVHWTQGH